MQKGVKSHPLESFLQKYISKIGLILALFSCLLYANTWTHDYAQDDAIVIYDNMYTKDGLSGISGLLAYDTFRGFFKKEGKSKLVSGGRYRPLTPVMFAVGWEIFGYSPMVGHILNSLFYGLLIWVIFKMLLLAFRDRKVAGMITLAFITTLLYATHPLHTEAVANIKGRDEIMAMLLSMLSLYWIIQWVDTSRLKYAMGAGVALFLGLMSKENSITFLAIVPLTLIFFRSKGIVSCLKYVTPLVAATIVFLGIRTMVLGIDMGGEPMELMNNPFLKIEGNTYVPFSLGERAATILFTLGKYIQLCFFPHPLTHDYYPRHIEMMTFASAEVWMSIFMYGSMLTLAFLGWKKKSIYSYGILYFLITLSIVSNVVFPIGTNMSERFMFMPSLGFALIMGFLIHGLIFRLQKNGVGYMLLGVMVVCFSIKTVTRNQVWLNDDTLFLSDQSTSYRSAKLSNAVGGTLISMAQKEADGNKRIEMYKEAVESLERALNIHPNYKNAHLLLANAYHYLNQFEEADNYYLTALDLDAGFEDAIMNQAINYREWGKSLGMQHNDANGAIDKVMKAMPYLEDDYESNRLLGTANGILGNHQEALKYFLKCAELEPENVEMLVNVTKAYTFLGDEANRQKYMDKAQQINPDAFK